MTTKDHIKAEIDTLDEHELEKLHQFIVQMTHEKKPSLMAKLKQIKIDAPKDFSENLEGLS